MIITLYVIILSIEEVRLSSRRTDNTLCPRSVAFGKAFIKANNRYHSLQRLRQ